MSFSQLLSIGYNALRDGKCEFACHALKRAVQLQANSVEARRYLMFALMESGNPKAAEEQLIALRLLGHEDASYDLRIAMAYRKTGFNDKAIALLEFHLKRHKGDVDAIVMLSDALMAANERDRALELCQRAMSLVSSQRDQARLQEKYTALKNVEPAAQAPSTSINDSPLESRGS
jgi:tetratricopeptide (TPR) repeat protein